MSEPSTDADLNRRTAPSERLLDSMENLVHRLGERARHHQDGTLTDIQHRLWILNRILRGDEDLSEEDIQIYL